MFEFDYVSLSTLSQSTLHELHFYINHFMNWCSSSGQSQGGNKVQGIEWFRTGVTFIRPIYVTPDLYLWYNERHHKDMGDPLFLLRSDPQTGDDIPFRELNYIRQYIDLPPEGLIMDGRKRDLNFVDFYQNTLLMNTLNEVPLIMELILKWFRI